MGGNFPPLVIFRGVIFQCIVFLDPLQVPLKRAFFSLWPIKILDCLSLGIVKK